MSIPPIYLVGYSAQSLLFHKMELCSPEVHDAIMHSLELMNETSRKIRRDQRMSKLPPFGIVSRTAAR